jgi:exopolyphosphatase/guanosine-5'-triphosphate,3'-diphosphate pyrophosphatase
MALFERTSRYGFHLLKEIKSRARISENAYKNGGTLQPAATLRAKNALGDFAKLAKSYGARKIIAVATSAVRDAPNRLDFLRETKEATGLQIRVIGGEEEAKLGGIAAANLLAVQEGVTIDIGGGSTELALVKNGAVVEAVSFNLGTVRLKELFFDEARNIKGATRFIEETLKNLPASFASERIIGVGGTMRALADSIIKMENYPFGALHGFTFSLRGRDDFFDRIIKSDFGGLKNLGFKPERFDVIREGTLIFKIVAKTICAKEAITSGAGVREGAFLKDLLRSSGGKLPNGVAPSLVSLLDRFGDDRKQTRWLATNAARLFETLRPLHKLDDGWQKPLIAAAKLIGTGAAIDPYYPSEQESLLAKNGLSYGFTHSDRLLIAALLKIRRKKELIAWNPPKNLEKLLPEAKTAKWLALILLIAQTINVARDRPKIDCLLDGSILLIANVSYLGAEAFERFKPPFDLVIKIDRPAIAPKRRR